MRYMKLIVAGSRDEAHDYVKQFKDTDAEILPQDWCYVMSADDLHGYVGCAAVPSAEVPMADLLWIGTWYRRPYQDIAMIQREASFRGFKLAER